MTYAVNVRKNISALFFVAETLANLARTLHQIINKKGTDVFLSKEDFFILSFEV